MRLTVSSKNDLPKLWKVVQYISVQSAKFIHEELQALEFKIQPNGCPEHITI